MAPTVRQRNQANGKKELKRQAGKKQSHHKAEEAVSPSPHDLGIVYPSGDTAFKALLSARFCAAIWSHVTDCDETYNYWEPMHCLLFDSGLQTWEYSPEYALRSYTYLLIHAGPAWIYHRLFQPNRMLIFYFSRCLLGLLAAFSEVYFYKAVCREFGVQVGRMLLALLVFSAGMFVAGTAFLPASFCMCCTCVALGAWFQRRYALAVFATAVSALLGWPFAALVGLPIAADMLIRRREILSFLQWSVISLVAILGPMVWIDSSYFGRLVVAPYNIVRYNVFTSHGPDLYGTEPWTFYFVNLFLNFNLVFVAALAAPIMLAVVHWVVVSKPRNPACLSYWLSLSPLFLWMAVFFPQAHKEERFMFPVYPCICLCGAVCLDALQKLYFRFLVRTAERGSHYLNHTTWLMITSLTICSLASVARILALYHGYHAPLDAYMELTSISNTHKMPGEMAVCVGKEWHRYPSSFFLPRDNMRLRFLRSDFTGQLPGYYVNSTQHLPEHVNDMNREEEDRYYDVERCHFIVDADFERPTKREPNYSEQKDKWKVVKSIPFLDASQSHRFFRAFFIPFVSKHFCSYVPYNLLQSTRLKLVKKDTSPPK